MRTPAWLLGVGLSVCSTGCRPGCAGPEAEPACYEVRGQVVRREHYDTTSRLLISHERIEDFRGRDGKVAPMPAMHMLFGLSPELSAAPAKPGDKLRFKFCVRWDQRPVLLITALSALDPDVTLAVPEASPATP